MSQYLANIAGKLVDKKIEIKNMGKIDNFSTKLGSAHSRLHNLGLIATRLCEAEVKIQLQRELPEEKHRKLYRVYTRPSGFVSSVFLEPIDERGAYLYRGFKGFSYASDKPMGPLPDGNFIMRFKHPGVVGKKVAINRAMRTAAKNTRRNLARDLRQIARLGL
jgi:hypothetical protein